MYQLAGLNFYEERDSDDVLIEAYIKTTKSRRMRQLFSLGTPDVDLDILSSADEMFAEDACEVMRKSRKTLCYIINNEIAYDLTETYEYHWLDFIGTYDFKASIVKFNTGLFYAAAKSIGEETNPVTRGLVDLNESKYLKIDTISDITNVVGQKLCLSKFFILTAIDRFTGSTVSPDALYIRYAPAMDIGTVLGLTRFLHLML